MCNVQRVVNSCGHTNDHVLIVCHIAKVPTPPMSANQSESRLDSPRSSFSNPAYDFLYSRRQFIAWPIGDPRGWDLDQTKPSGDGNKPVNKGFHASTDPYCKYAKIHELDSPKGFKCMVPGCGRAD